MMKIAIITSVLLMFFHQINGQCLGLKDDKKPNRSDKQSLYTGEQEFSLKLLRAVNQLNPEGNLFFSPYSTYHALLLAYFISAGKTENFLKNALKLNTFSEKSDLMHAYKLDKLRTKTHGDEYEFSNANRIYVDNKINIRDCIPTLFRDEFDRLDFYNKPEESRLSINSWVENQTHSMIRDLLPPGAVDQTTNLVLVNAGYFKGKWKYEFDEQETKEDVFYISPSKMTMVDMMHLEGAFNHAQSEELGAHIIELPYKGEKVSMYILLPPTQGDGIANTLKKLTVERFQDLIKELDDSFGKQVKLFLPKFSLEQTIEMTPILESLGVGNLFRSDSDFYWLSDQNLSLGAGIHKAKIEVDEKGSQAAAATALFGFRMMSEEPQVIEFKCDHPFIFMLYNKDTKTFMFTGVYRKPE